MSFTMKALGVLLALFIVTVNSHSAARCHCKILRAKVDELTKKVEAIDELTKRVNASTSKKVYKNCAEVYKSGDRISGKRRIDPDGLGEFEVFCDQTTAGGGWTVFQRRTNGFVDFFRTWAEYKRGFGNLNSEFWLGLDKLYRLTVRNNNELRVDLSDVEGNTAYAVYSTFAVANEAFKYMLSLGSYSGTAGDSLTYHRGMSFSTKDRDNDFTSRNCALSFKGAWWYNSCYRCNLNGPYLPGVIDNEDGEMSWKTWKNSYYSVKSSQMKIRPVDF